MPPLFVLNYPSLLTFVIAFVYPLLYALLLLLNIFSFMVTHIVIYYYTLMLSCICIFATTRSLVLVLRAMGPPFVSNNM